MGLMSFPAAAALDVTAAVVRATGGVTAVADPDGGFRATWLAAPTWADMPTPMCVGAGSTVGLLVGTLLLLLAVTIVFRPWTGPTAPAIVGLEVTSALCVGRKFNAAIVTAREPRGSKVAGGGRWPGARTALPPDVAAWDTKLPHWCCCC
jgi:hypothetical protein